MPCFPTRTIVRCFFATQATLCQLRYGLHHVRQTYHKTDPYVLWLHTPWDTDFFTRAVTLQKCTLSTKQGLCSREKPLPYFKLRTIIIVLHSLVTILYRRRWVRRASHVSLTVEATGWLQVLWSYDKHSSQEVLEVLASAQLVDRRGGRKNCSISAASLSNCQRWVPQYLAHNNWFYSIFHHT